MLLSKRTKKKLELNFVLTIYFTKFKKKKTILGCKYIKIKSQIQFSNCCTALSLPILNNKFAS